MSETDTEVIPKLLSYVYQSYETAAAANSDHPKTPGRTGSPEGPMPFPSLVMEVMRRLEGAYALLVRSSRYPGEVIACKHGSPLILGFKGGDAPQLARSGSFTQFSDSDDKSKWAPALECFFASDASALVEKTKQVIILEDGDLVHVRGGGWGIYNVKETRAEYAVVRVLQTLEVEVEQIMKAGYNHYMQKEIYQQPESIIETMRGRVLFPNDHEGGHISSSGPLGVKLGGVASHLDLLCRSRRIVFVACGTSYNACLAARSTVEQLVDVAVELELASDLLDRQSPIFRGDTCVFVSQSGETADTLHALHYAKSRGAFCVGITNTVGSAISRTTHCGIHQNAGYEIGVASTKAYTSQIVCITMMALAMSKDSVVKASQREKIIEDLVALPEKVRKALLLDERMRHLAVKVDALAQRSNSLLFFGRGSDYATALEAALKMKEIALIHSEGILAGEMKHGPLALVDDTLPIIVIATRDLLYAKMRSVIQQLLARGGRLVVVCNEDDVEMHNFARDHEIELIEVPAACHAIQPIINIIPIQLLAYHLTILRGHNVDQPRNLAKAVTVAD